MIGLLNIGMLTEHKQKDTRGRKSKTEAMYREEYPDVFNCLDKLMSLSQIKAATGVSICTISKLRARFNGKRLENK